MSMSYPRRALHIVLVSSVILVSLPYAPTGASTTQTEECGTWKWEGPGEEKDLRIKTTLIIGSSGDDCHGAFRLKNDTGVWWLGGGYSLALRAHSENANIVWRPPPPAGAQSVLLTPWIDVELHGTPLNRTSGGQVFVTGDMTLGTVAVDTSIFLLKAVLALAPPGLSCWIPEEHILFTGIRLSNILVTATELALRGDFTGAWWELLQIAHHFYEASGEVMVGLGIDCAAEIFKGAAKRPVIIAKIAWAYLTWVPIVIWDYIKYRGQSANVLVVYTYPDFGPAAIWKPTPEDFAEFQRCHLQSSSPMDCVVSVMQSSGASPQAIEFTRLLNGEAFMESFEEFGAVDLAMIVYPIRANDNFQYVLINGTPRIVHAEDVWEMDISRDANYPALVRKYPNLLLWGGDNRFERTEQLLNGGQRFVFRYSLVNGCHACETDSYALVAFDFDSTGRFLGMKLLSLGE